MKRPKCSEEFRLNTSEPCENPATFYVEPLGRLGERQPVCGICARQYIAEALHPLRMKDWVKWYPESPPSAGKEGVPQSG